MDRLPTEPAEARAIFEERYGRPEATSITPHQRVKMALHHEEPDQTPFDFWAVPEVWASLRRHLDTDNDGDVLRLLGVGCRWVRPDYVGLAPIVQEDGSDHDAFGCFGPLRPGRHASGEHRRHVHCAPGTAG